MIGIKMCMHLLQSVQLCTYVHTYIQYIRKCSIYTHALYVHVYINYIYIQYVCTYVLYVIFCECRFNVILDVLERHCLIQGK